MSIYIYTYEEASSKLKEANDAVSKILKSQEYRQSDRSQRRALLSEAMDLVKKWEGIVKEHISANPSIVQELEALNKKRRKGPKVFYHGISG